MKGGQSSLDKHKKQQVATVRRPISTDQPVKIPNLDYTHFVSLPLAIHRELVEKLEGFQKSVLEEVNVIPGDMNGSSCADSKHLKGPNTTAMGIDRSIFINPQTFHLTVLMLNLWNRDRVAMATKILKEISLKVMDALENRPVSIRLRGVACMKGSPAKAHVVYAPVEEVSGDGRLLRACQVIIDAYVEAGLVLQKDARHSLKLHATLMNSRHRKRKMHTIRHDSFDARDIFKRYGLEDWGEYIIREAHLSQRFIYDECGYYHCCGSIPFPGKSGRLSVDSGSNSQSRQPASSRNHHHPPSAISHHHPPQAAGRHRRPPSPSTTTANAPRRTPPPVATSSSTITNRRQPLPPPPSATISAGRRPPPPPDSCHLL